MKGGPRLVSTVRNLGIYLKVSFLRGIGLLNLGGIKDRVLGTDILCLWRIESAGSGHLVMQILHSFA